MKEAQGRFRKASDDLDSSLNKHVGAPKAKPIECDEAANQLLVSRSKFTSASLEYTDKVGVMWLTLTSPMNWRSLHLHIPDILVLYSCFFE